MTTAIPTVPTVSIPLRHPKCFCIQLTVPDDVAPTNTELDQLWAMKPVEHGTVKFLGKVLTVPRTQVNLGKDYYFSGQMHHAIAPLTWHPTVVRLRDFVAAHSGIDPQLWQQCLLNYYEDGTQRIGPHSDDEKQLIPDSPIYSFSFGATRDFVLKSRDKSERHVVPMPTNTCLVMFGATQTFYTHEVPVRKGVTDRRLNFTYRAYRDAGAKILRAATK